MANASSVAVSRVFRDKFSVMIFLSFFVQSKLKIRKKSSRPNAAK
jgi:hypothetical protein